MSKKLLPILILCSLVFGGTMTWDFENVASGKVPQGFIKAPTFNGRDCPGTNQILYDSALATWEVFNDTAAVSGNKVFGITDSGTTETGAYNICYLPVPAIKNFRMEAKVKCISGSYVNAGFCWRVKDVKNYYMFRYHNGEFDGHFMMSSMVQGCRNTQLGPRTKYIMHPNNVWFTLKAEMQGDHFTVEFISNDPAVPAEKRHLTISGNDTSLSDAGGFGFYSKGESIIAFDDFSITSDEIPGVGMQNYHESQKPIRKQSQPYSLVQINREKCNFSNTILFDLFGRPVQKSVHSDGVLIQQQIRPVPQN